MKVLMISRAACFSPNAVDRDRAVFRAVADRLEALGCEIALLSEDERDALGSLHDTGLILTMARRPATLEWLKSTGIPTVNSPEGIGNCCRSRLEALMLQLGIPIPPKEDEHGYWVKRGDSAAQSAMDVVYASDEKALAEAVGQMEARGIRDYTVSAHVVGDLVKFYGVSGTGFFRYRYPTDDGQTKFGDERRNPAARHYHFSERQLQHEAERLAEAVGVQVWGGDAIVRSDGSFCLIDFNDWPSFASCREEAAEAIVIVCNILFEKRK